jgi:hypothetical protein
MSTFLAILVLLAIIAVTKFQVKEGYKKNNKKNNKKSKTTKSGKKTKSKSKKSKTTKSGKKTKSKSKKSKTTKTTSKKKKTAAKKTGNAKKTTTAAAAAKKKAAAAAAKKKAAAAAKAAAKKKAAAAKAAAKKKAAAAAAAKAAAAAAAAANSGRDPAPLTETIYDDMDNTVAAKPFMDDALLGDSQVDPDVAPESAQPIVVDDKKLIAEVEEDGPMTGNVSYVLMKGAQEAPEEIKKQIIQGMDQAVNTYNRYSTFTKVIKVNYDPNIPTAQVGWDGTEGEYVMTYGNMFGYRVTLHELGHAFGAGIHPRWSEFVKDDMWTGPNGIRVLKEIDGPDAVLYADRLHFWPHGMNYDNELTPGADRKHVLLVDAMVKDLAS